PTRGPATAGQVRPAVPERFGGLDPLLPAGVGHLAAGVARGGGELAHRGPVERAVRGRAAPGPCPEEFPQPARTQGKYAQNCRRNQQEVDDPARHRRLAHDPSPGPDAGTILTCRANPGAAYFLTRTQGRITPGRSGAGPWSRRRPPGAPTGLECP